MSVTVSLELPNTSKKLLLNDETTNVITWRPGGWDPEEGTWIWPHHPPCETAQRAGTLAPAQPQTSRLSLPGADAFGHCDDVTQAGCSFDLCARAHRHGHQFFSQSVANLCMPINKLDQHLRRKTSCFKPSDSFMFGLTRTEQINGNPVNFKFKQHIPELISS